jgi:hypothetical protein
MCKQIAHEFRAACDAVLERQRKNPVAFSSHVTIAGPVVLAWPGSEELVPMESTHPDHGALDDLLQRLEPFASELANGLTSHAPMVVEALWNMGRIDAAGPWLERYRADLLPRSPAAPALADSEWRDALGHPAREAAWFARFAADIAAVGWADALARWTERLAPGFAAAAAHGVIRTAHAARGLSRAETAARRTELAAGLALWASSWQTLPGDPVARTGSLGAREALQAVPLVPSPERRNAGAITTALEVLAGRPEFAAALAGLAPVEDTGQLALDLARAFAEQFVEQVRTPLHAIVFTHAITGVQAARCLVHWLPAPQGEALVGYAWQTGAALRACYAEPDPRRPAVAIPTVEALVEAAVAHGDEHVIKLADAAVELHAATADPVFLAAAARARQVIPPHSG